MSNLFSPIPNISYDGPRDFSPTFQPAEPIHTLLQNTRFNPKRVSDLLKMGVTPIPWLVAGLIPEDGICIFSGFPGHGKSWILLHLALCLLSGNPLFGKFSVSKTSGVLLLDEEDGEFLKLRRLLDMGITDVPNGFFIQCYAGYKAANPHSTDELLGICQKESIKVVLIDSFVRVISGDENSSTETSKVFEQLRTKLCANGITVVLTHHQRKPGKDASASMHEMRGSSDIPASLDSHLSVSKAGEELTFRQGKLRQAEKCPDFTVRMSQVGGFISFDYQAEKVDELEFSINDAIASTLENLGRANRGTIVDIVSKATGASEAKVIKQLDYLVKTDPSFIEFAGENNARLYRISQVGENS